MGKVGAFVGTYVLPLAQENAPNPIRAGQDPFFISSSLCILSAVLTWLFMPYIGQVSHLLARRVSAFDPGLIRPFSSGQDTITEEDHRFREYLEANGYDTSTLGNKSQ